MINGTSVVIQNGSGDIVGQMAMTLTFNGTPIDIGNQSFDQWVVLMNDHLGTKQLQISGSIVYNDDDQFRKVRHDAFNGILDTYIVSYVSNDIVSQMFTASMMPNALSDAFPHGDKLITSISLLSSGIVFFDPPPCNLHIKLYTGNGATQSILNGVDSIESDSLTWIKSRTTIENHALFDTLRGAFNPINSNRNSAVVATPNSLTSFNSDGFTLGDNSIVNANSEDYASWTFTRETKFLDIITYLGNGSRPREILHNLGVQAGLVFTKSLNFVADWGVQHISRGGTKYLNLNTDGLELESSIAWDNTTMTDSAVTVSSFSLSNGFGVNYIMYVFAHDPSPQGVIQCDEYTGNGSFTGPLITLGWRPKYIMIKCVTRQGSWTILDENRGLSDSPILEGALRADTDGVETDLDVLVETNGNGFQPVTDDSNINRLNEIYIYMAIREC